VTSLSKDLVMTASLSVAQIALLAAYAVGMAGGQILFKTAAIRLPAGELGARALALAGNGWFLAAIALYAGLSVLWVWVLTFTPLSRAYPFVAIAFALTPLVGALVFGEPLSLRLLVGIAVVAVGLVLIAG
jgi:multidrug transporter EmrE-like cation transporter